MADGVLLRRVAPFGYLRIDAYVPLPVAFRSLSRPSSAPDAKAFPLRSFSLDLRQNESKYLVFTQASKLKDFVSFFLPPHEPISLGFARIILVV